LPDIRLTMSHHGQAYTSQSAYNPLNWKRTRIARCNCHSRRETVLSVVKPTVISRDQDNAAGRVCDA